MPAVTPAGIGTAVADGLVDGDGDGAALGVGDAVTGSGEAATGRRAAAG
ncbi:hypothetical protein GCM10007977_057940 [Dactylosporangium sucinum]|uniref:Uncharacterized protein n=1 Tax=Dactylosporangium sucinum TaxID=1424081 RepID=A0A917U033_9ACTN|nr:hypothetical protein GCM10007977_057940 [Dactylosporangium sucinum]